MKRSYILVLIGLFSLTFNVWGQNKHEEVLRFEMIDGKIVFPATIKGKEYKFIYDPMVVYPAVLDEYADEMGVSKNNKQAPYGRPGVTVVSGGSLTGFCVGKNIFVKKLGVFAVKSDYLKNIGVAGIMNVNPFVGYVLTFNSKDKTLTTSTPYKPKYISLKNSTALNLKTLHTITMDIAGTPVDVVLDLAGNPDYVHLSPKDFALHQVSFKNIGQGVDVHTMPAYKEMTVKGSEAVATSVTLAHNTFDGMKLYSLAQDSASSVGSKFLEDGLLSVDYVKGRVYFQRFAETDPAKMDNSGKTKASNVQAQSASLPIVDLTRDNFADLIFDYRNQTVWKYKGSKPAIIDFWAEWCGPCKRLAPYLEELAREYKDQIVVYKLNIDDEPELAKYFNVSAIPLLMYIPVGGKPQKRPGAFPKDVIKSNIESILLKSK